MCRTSPLDVCLEREKNMISTTFFLAFGSNMCIFIAIQEEERATDFAVSPSSLEYKKTFSITKLGQAG